MEIEDERRRLRDELTKLKGKLTTGSYRASFQSENVLPCASTKRKTTIKQSVGEVAPDLELKVNDKHSSDVDWRTADNRIEGHERKPVPSIMQELTMLKGRVDSLNKGLCMMNSSARAADAGEELEALRRENSQLKRTFDAFPKMKTSGRRGLSKYSSRTSASSLPRSKSNKRVCQFCLELMTKGFPSVLCQRHTRLGIGSCQYNS